MNAAKIRMIFCDVDGTLLPHNHDTLSQDVFDVIKKATLSDVFICIASGRSYTDLKKLFAPALNDLIFICNDGALTIKNDEILFSSPLNKAQVKCMSRTYKNDYTSMLLYTKSSTYYLGSKNFDFANKISSDDIASIPEDIYKIAFFELSEKAKIKINNLGIKSGILNKVYEDNYWTEYITAQTDKGTASKAVQEMFGISISQTAAFGDNINDIGMLRRAQFTFAPQNANPEIIKMCKYTTNNVTNQMLSII